MANVEKYRQWKKKKKTEGRSSQSLYLRRRFFLFALLRTVPAAVRKLRTGKPHIHSFTIGSEVDSVNGSTTARNDYIGVCWRSHTRYYRMSRLRAIPFFDGQTVYWQHCKEFRFIDPKLRSFSPLIGAHTQIWELSLMLLFRKLKNEIPYMLWSDYDLFICYYKRPLSDTKACIKGGPARLTGLSRDVS